MMVGNGSPTAGEVVWQSTPITIDAATNYFFEAYVMNVCCNANYGGGNSSPVLTFTSSLDGGPANDLQNSDHSAHTRGRLVWSFDELQQRRSDQRNAVAD